MLYAKYKRGNAKGARIQYIRSVVENPEYLVESESSAGSLLEESIRIVLESGL